MPLVQDVHDEHAPISTERLRRALEHLMQTNHLMRDTLTCYERQAELRARSNERRAKMPPHDGVKSTQTCVAPVLPLLACAHVAAPRGRRAVSRRGWHGRASDHGVERSSAARPHGASWWRTRRAAWYRRPNKIRAECSAHSRATRHHGSVADRRGASGRRTAARQRHRAPNPWAIDAREARGSSHCNPQWQRRSMRASATRCTRRSTIGDLAGG